MVAMTTTLENLDKDLKMKKFYNIAEHIIKYQKFRNNVALTKMSSLNISDSTKMSYFNLGINYLRTGERHKSLPSTLYNCIDDLVAKHVQPLTPSVEEERLPKRKSKVYQRKNATLPVAKLEIVNKPLLAKVEYGVKVDSTIMLMPSRDYALGFLDGLKNLNKNKDIEAKVVTVEIGDIKENE